MKIGDYVLITNLHPDLIRDWYLNKNKIYKICEIHNKTPLDRNQWIKIEANHIEPHINDKEYTLTTKITARFYGVKI
jgi:hypothetical protein